MDSPNDFIGKVKVNYSLYSGFDYYSDGDIEDEMLAMIQETDDVFAIIAKDNRWPILYHFSPLRQNLLEWYDFHAGATALEIGAGCGALTGVLCSKQLKVTAVDISKRRCLINAHRNKEFDNLEIVVANFQDLTYNERFDYITVIGVLEYAMLYMDGDTEAYRNFMLRVKDMLTPGGVAIIAIENKVGLKYWNGAREDHTGREYEGIEDYPNSSNIRTFSKKELVELLEDTGLQYYDFYYPYPDYKMPLQIFSDRHLPGVGEIFQKQSNYDADKISLFDENRAVNTIVKAGLFGEFANSFLVFAKKEKDREDI
jgi:2-polyprenyl-3-methyl-5-hydroxy-6-metoxy-1,4-benzoquinol methylase